MCSLSSDIIQRPGHMDRIPGPRATAFDQRGGRRHRLAIRQQPLQRQWTVSLFELGCLMHSTYTYSHIRKGNKLILKDPDITLIATAD
jgi:hypothetical protein